MLNRNFWQITRNAWLLAAVGGFCVIGSAQTARAQAAICPPGQDCPCTWSAWVDRDDPTGVGDFEDLASLYKEKKVACLRPTAIQCRYKGGAVWGSQVLPQGPGGSPPVGYVCNVSVGGTCTNAKTKPPGTQANPSCKDSEIRVCCPSLK